jgi:8-oxo-dGTP diphosphatase
MNRPLKYCAHCGGLLTAQTLESRERPVCGNCGNVVYLNPIPSVAAILTQHGRLVLVRRKIEPGYGRWSLPGGFIEAAETVEQAVVREVEEETGLTCRPEGVLDVQSVLGGFYGDILVICYAARIIGGALKAGGDADDVQFFDAAHLPAVAFDVHRSFIRKHCASTTQAGHE